MNATSSTGSKFFFRQAPTGENIPTPERLQESDSMYNM